jgi:E3 ubiquitin-protein transferase RMND5
LEFKLHRLQFINLAEKGVEHQAEAVNYARTHLSQFVTRHEREIQNLMGALLFLPQGLPTSPYSHLLDPYVWVEIHEVFMKDACALLGQSVDSPLSVCINAGCTALPALLNIKQVRCFNLKLKPISD